MRHLPRAGYDDGMFLCNAGLIYRDPGCGGAHLEYATPECVHPTDAVRHLLVGERIIAGAAASLATVFPDREIVPVAGKTISFGGGGPHCITQQIPATA